MRITRVAVALGLAMLMFSVAIGDPVSAPAMLPTLVVGHAVGYGLNLDLTALAAPFLTMIRNNPTRVNITALRELSFTGSFDAWFYEKVAAVTPTYYEFEKQSASGLKFQERLNADFNNLPAPGTYRGTISGGICTFSRLPIQTGSVQLNSDFTALVTNSGTSRYAAANYALSNSTDQVISAVRASLTMRHAPSLDANLTSCVETVTYVDRDLTFSSDTSTQLRTHFTPALDYYNFPINDREIWYANASMTFGATLSGTVNVGGLTTQQEAGFFQNLTRAFQSVPGLAVTGLDHFPIDLARIRVTAGGVPVLDNGVLHDQTQSVSLHLQASQGNMTLADGTFHPIYKITQYFPPGTCQASLAAIYSPDDGMIVGFQLFSCSGTTPVLVAELKNVPPATAQSNIHRTETTYAPVAAAPSSILDFFVQSPYIGLILVAGAVIVIAALAMRRRRKPTMAAPPPGMVPEEPGMMPPPGPPPG